MAVRVGVIGAGAYAQRAHLPPLREHPDAEIAALCRRNPVRLAEAADAFDVPGRYTDYADLLADDSLDAVTISLPHNLHYQAARAALNRGLHVLVDKPLTLRLDHAHELVTLADQRGQTLMVAFNRHYEPPFTRARELLADGAIGDLRLIQAFMAYDWDLWMQPSDHRFTGAARRHAAGRFGHPGHPAARNQLSERRRGQRRRILRRWRRPCPRGMPLAGGLAGGHGLRADGLA